MENLEQNKTARKDDRVYLAKPLGIGVFRQLRKQ